MPVLPALLATIAVSLLDADVSETSSLDTRFSFSRLFLTSIMELSSEHNGVNVKHNR